MKGGCSPVMYRMVGKPRGMVHFRSNILIPDLVGEDRFHSFTSEEVCCGLPLRLYFMVMFIPLFRDWKIRTKLISVTLFVVLFPLLCVAFLSMNRFGKALKNASDEDLEHLVRNVYSMCKVHQEMVQKKVTADLNVAREIIYLHGHQIEIVPEEKVSFDAINQFTKHEYPITVPLWRIGDIRLKPRHTSCR